MVPETAPATKPLTVLIAIEGVCDPTIEVTRRKRPGGFRRRRSSARLGTCLRIAPDRATDVPQHDSVGPERRIAASDGYDDSHASSAVRAKKAQLT